MKIECSGPNGETFEAQTEVVSRQTYAEQAEEFRLQYDRIQKALETWCDMIKANNPPNPAPGGK